MKRTYLLWTAAIITVLDQLVKYLIGFLNPDISVIPNIFSITYIRNFGAGFGILQNQRMLLTLISIIVLAAIIYYYKKIPEKPIPVIPIALIAGGTIGNLIDRIFRGYVVDFLNFSFWPAFNVADSSLTIGVILLAWYFWKEDKKENKN